MVLGFTLTFIITTFTSINPVLCIGLINVRNVLVLSQLLQVVSTVALNNCHTTVIKESHVIGQFEFTTIYVT